jgi:hypothetical protein
MQDVTVLLGVLVFVVALLQAMGASNRTLRMFKKAAIGAGPAGPRPA